MKYFNNENDFKGNMDKMDPVLLAMLDDLREEYGYPIILNSSYRSPDHPIEAKKNKPGEHTYGAAVDIKCIGGEATFKLVKAAIEVGFTRIGISRKSNFVHVGIGYPGAPETTIWTY
jgi:zinc D-Ala-D-Ala carboxypeptidase